jgi:type I restriction enzyme S subunit
MEVKPGFKQTDVGVIPEDWITATLESAVGSGGLVRGPFGGALKKDIFVDRGYKVYEQRNAIYESVEKGDYFIDSTKFRELERFRVKPGDFIVSCSGTIGCIYQIPSSAPEGVINQALLKISLNQEKVSGRFFLAIFRSASFQERIKENSHGGAMQNLVGMQVFRRTQFQLPPTRSEQEAIAEALSDADTLIESVEQLLAKKRHLRRGAMQNLLTGKKRLPGFSGEWEVKPLGNLFNFSGGFSASRDQLSSDGHCYLHYGDIHTSTKFFVDVRSEYQDIPKLNIPLNKVSSASLLDDGDVVFVDASEDDEGTSKHVVIINPDRIPFISGLHTIVAKSKTNALEHQYRRYCFQTTAVKAQFRFFAVGTKVSGISKTNIVKITLPVPSVPEQTAIAAILSDMDAEIAALEEKLAKGRQIKKGMMQELLTGRIRLT